VLTQYVTPATKNISHIQVLVTFLFQTPPIKEKTEIDLAREEALACRIGHPNNQKKKKKTKTNKQTQKEDLKAPSECYQQQQTQWKKEGGGRTRTRRIISFFGLWFSLFSFLFLLPSLFPSGLVLFCF